MVSHEIERGFKFTDALGQVKVMAVADGWAMCRRPYAAPFVIRVNQVEACVYDSGARMVRDYDDKKELRPWQAQTMGRIKRQDRVAVEMPAGAGKARRVIFIKDGLLYENGRVVDCPEADRIAQANGHHCAEQFVRAHPDRAHLILNIATNKIEAKNG